MKAEMNSRSWLPAIAELLKVATANRPRPGPQDFWSLVRHVVPGALVGVSSCYITAR